MFGYKLCLGTSEQFGCDLIEQIKLFKDTGFDAFFVNWNKNTDIKEIKEYADSQGMYFQSVHAPFGNSAHMWNADGEWQNAVHELLLCLKDCADNNIPIMVCHAVIGFDMHTPNDFGIENFRKIVDEANRCGVNIAFENTEGEEYLKALMEAFSDCKNVGFCWDTGHEMCYNHSRDMLGLYGDRLLCTHLNDNLGISDSDGKIFWTDDLHLLPFDGVADWEDITRRLNEHNYNGVLTFELCKISKPNRHENDVYERMSIEDYVCEAYKRACRVAMLKRK